MSHYVTKVLLAWEAEEGRNMWLLIDDERNLGTEAIARTPEAGKKLLAVGGWECLCLDHDLGTIESGYEVTRLSRTF